MSDSLLPIINEVSESASNIIGGGLVAYDSDSDSSSSDSDGPSAADQQLKSSTSNNPPLPPPTLFAGSRALAKLGVNLAPAVPEALNVCTVYLLICIAIAIFLQCTHYIYRTQNPRLAPLIHTRGMLPTILNLMIFILQWYVNCCVMALQSFFASDYY